MSDLLTLSDAVQALRKAIQDGGPAEPKRTAECVIAHRERDVEILAAQLDGVLPRAARDQLDKLYIPHGTTVNPELRGRVLRRLDDLLAELKKSDRLGHLENAILRILRQVYPASLQATDIHTALRRQGRLVNPDHLRRVLGRKGRLRTANLVAHRRGGGLPLGR